MKKKTHLLLYEQFAEEQQSAVSETSLVKPVEDKIFSVADMKNRPAILIQICVMIKLKYLHLETNYNSDSGKS